MHTNDYRHHKKDNTQILKEDLSKVIGSKIRFVLGSQKARVDPYTSLVLINLRKQVKNW